MARVFSNSVAKRFLTLIFWTLGLAVLHAEVLEFPQQFCAIELPGSSTWEVQKSDAIPDESKVLVAISDDRKIVGSIVVQDLFPPTKKDRDDFLAGARFGLTKSGWKVTSEKDHPFGDLIGHFIGAKSVKDGITSVQTSFYLFANNRTYTISAAIVAEKVTPELVKRATDFIPGFKLLPQPKTP